MADRVFTEQDAASVGPIELKDIGSPQWCWQTITQLQSQWNAVTLDLALYEQTWADAEEHRIWEKVPYEDPYGSKEEMLRRLELGDVPATRLRVMERAMDARPLGKTGGHRKKGETQRVVVQHAGSSNADYLSSRIARDRPDIWERMKRGEFKSVAAAAREAGIPVNISKRVVLSDDILRVSKALRVFYTAEQLQKLTAFITSEDVEVELAEEAK